MVTDKSSVSAGFKASYEVRFNYKALSQVMHLKYIISRHFFAQKNRKMGAKLDKYMPKCRHKNQRYLDLIR